MPIIKNTHLNVVLGAGVAMLALYGIQQRNTQIANNMLYHGSCLKFEAPKPMYNERWSHPIRTWAGHGVFATHDRRIALIYTSTTSHNEYTQGVDLKVLATKNEPIVLMLFGGKSKEEALDNLYGDSSPGYIYHLHSKGFTREEGLGKMETVSRNTPHVQKVEVVNRKAEIIKYVEQGLMKISWQPSYRMKI